MGSDRDKSKRRRIEVDGLSAQRKSGQYNAQMQVVDRILIAPGALAFAGTMTIQLVGPKETLGVILETRQQAEAIRDMLEDTIERAFPRGTN